MNLFKRLNIQSKLILALLLVSLLSILTVTFIGYTQARTAFTTMVKNQLVGQLVEKTNVLKSYLATMRNQVVILSDSRVGVEGMREFRTAFQSLRDVHLEPAMDEKLKEFYLTRFLAPLARNTSGSPILEQYLPTDPAARYLQYHYIANNPAPYEQGQDLPVAPDGSQWSALHKIFHPIFGKVATMFGFTDIYLVDSETMDIVYSYEKTVDIGTNLETGPYADTNLAEMVRTLRKANAKDAFKLADFQYYAPNLGKPSAFMGSPVFDGHRMIGIMVFQFPIDEVNRIMTGNFNWEAEGLGKTGEVYTVGRDFTLRSRSRFYYQDPKGFLGVLRDIGVAESIIRQIEHQNSTIMALQVETPPVEAALLGKEGIADNNRDYRNKEVITAYGPIDLDSLRWAVIAEMDTEEAYAPLRSFAKEILIAGSALALLTSLLALWIGRVLTRPISQLAEGARRVAAGETDVKVAVDSRDEFRELADAFNGMTRTLQQRNHDLEQKIHENEGLLLNILPAPAAARMREGDGDANQTFADVSVMYADVVGLDQDPEVSLAILKELVIAFDEAAERVGVEKVKTVASSYFAVCGLSVRRPDHVDRIIEFARDLMQIVRRFNAERKLNLEIEIGINAGPVVGGIVGRNKFIYDLWGDTVTIARALTSQRAMAIVVTDEVQQRLQGTRSFVPAADVMLPCKGPIKAWRLAD